MINLNADSLRLEGRALRPIAPVLPSSTIGVAAIRSLGPTLTTIAPASMRKPQMQEEEGQNKLHHGCSKAARNSAKPIE